MFRNTFPRRLNVLKCLSFIIGVITTVIYCEFVIYYVVIAQCYWPRMQSEQGQGPVRALMIADPHLLGPRLGHWLDRWRREGQMSTAFKAILNVHDPQVVFFLGDIFDEGSWSSERQFGEYVARFRRVFALPSHLQEVHVAGNHDVGFHWNTNPRKIRRFQESMNAPAVRLLSIKGSHFVLINSIAMEGDSCALCRKAVADVKHISKVLNCWKEESACDATVERRENYSRPILMQHFPLYRESDLACAETDDATPLRERQIPFVDKVDAISKQSTDFLVSSLNPRFAIGGHTHHGCRLQRGRGSQQLTEVSLASFNWRNRPDPRYYLVSITEDEVEMSICGLPGEATLVATAAVSLGLLTTILIRFNYFARLLNRYSFRT